MTNNILANALRKAIAEGRVCSRCGWMITKIRWAHGFRLCFGCEDALKGVNVAGGYSQIQQESVDKTGEML